MDELDSFKKSFFEMILIFLKILNEFGDDEK